MVNIYPRVTSRAIIPTHLLSYFILFYKCISLMKALEFVDVESVIQ